jgi:cadmium resistance protein CadD (predicted permease)
MLQHAFVALGLAVVLFVSTNVDDIFILLALFSNPGFRSSEVVAGQLIGMASLIALSLVGALLALVISPTYLGLLGLAPVALGVLQLLRKDDHDDATTAAVPAASSGWLRVLAVWLLTLANGGDNLGIYIPMFATAQRIDLVIYGATMFALSGLWCWIARALIQHPRLGAPIRRYAGPATPFVLIALGLYILIDSRAYAVLGLLHNIR